MEIDEFTFPTTNPDNTPIDSPPLWRLSPTASPTPSYEEAIKGLKLTAKIGENGNFYSRKSCSFLEGKCLMKRSKMCDSNNSTTQEYDQDHQEKMDMLWEDLNYEELFKSRRDSRNIDYHEKFTRGSNEVVEFGCVPTPFKLVRTNNIKSGNNKRLPSMIVLVKVLKRFFVLHQSAKKKRSR
ncbi:uncharacterized protein LOC125499502 [Beta vulgaris subsp. vulgaris]|uniref:uncharacterized protein LOC125499502 n=1 Tax=Beta vulgaris subsp. vulgaris TaxID=3555 RepID=UPI00203670B3|nr:uncharacterized protein LOC125499502 [Beta vulgaris subsp. vulgaris]